MTIGEYIKEYRRQSRMSQRDLAKASGLSPGYISMLENGIDRRSGELIVPSLETLKLLSLKKPTISEDDELDARIMGLVRRLPREQKLSLVDLLSVTVQGVKKK